MTDIGLERAAIALFERMLDVPEAERDAWLAREAAGQPELLARVSSMRAADLSASLRTGMAADALDEEVPPESIGAYRITGRIGRGGMGSVYRGERATGDFAHVVAIKVIKPGLLSETLVERFERERQVLANLSHPGIAQLYDGGETAAGSPYIVMEYVDGLPLLDWVDEERPSRAERQRMFQEIVAAVAFAHRNLIVHRDLTPSNVLVTRDGAAKLIDFGIARPADDEDAAGGTASIGSLSLTPGYAAPERMVSSAVTTAADIYSLGRLLEKLIPPAPGDRELKAIAARATRPDPLDRYPTADALGADIAAWRQGFPVSAVDGGVRYRLGKFVARHRVGVAAAMIAVVVLAGAFALTLQAWSQAESARQAEAARFRELRALAGFMLFDLDGRMERVVGNTEARVEMAARAQQYLSALAASPAADDALKLEAANGFVRLARIQGVPSEPNFGEREQAKANLDEAEKLLVSIEGDDAATAPVLARLRSHRALLQAHGDADAEAAAKSAVSAEAALARVPAAQRGPQWLEARSTLRKAQLELADLGGDVQGLHRFAGQLDRELNDWPAARQSSRAAELDRAYAAYYRAYATSIGEGGEAKSLPLFADAERRYLLLDRDLPNDPLVLYMLAWTGYSAFPAASRVGDARQSAHFITLARETADRLIAIEPNDNALHTLAGGIGEAEAQWLRDQGRFAEAVARQREVVARREAVLTPERTANALGNLAFSQAILGVIGRDAGNRALACASWDKAAANFGELKRRGELLGFYAEFLPGIRANVAKCEGGRPLSQMGPIR